MTARILEFPSSQATRAVTPESVVCFVQPILDLITSSTVGFELLARADGPGRPLEPDEFFPDLRRRGRLPELDLRMAECAAEIHAGIGRPTDGPLTLHLNLCPEALNDVDHLQRLWSVLQTRPNLPAAIVVEVTEEPGLRASSLEHLRALRRLGVRVAIDDFGAGYASYRRLSEDAFDLIKLDRSLISRITDSPRARAVIASLIRLAAEMGIELIAEGIESDLQQRLLEDLGCRLGQGYHCGRPFAAVALQGPPGLAAAGERSGASL